MGNVILLVLAAIALSFMWYLGYSGYCRQGMLSRTQKTWLTIAGVAVALGIIAQATLVVTGADDAARTMLLLASGTSGLVVSYWSLGVWLDPRTRRRQMN
jgi:hypothetical protein